VASGSTTPTYEPGGPPPISPALPPLEQAGDVPVVNMGMGISEQRKPGEGELLFLLVSSLVLRSHVPYGRKGISSLEQIQDIKIKKTLKVTLKLLTSDIYTHQYHPCSLPTKSMHHCAALRYIGKVGEHIRIVRDTSRGTAASLFLNRNPKS